MRDLNGMIAKIFPWVLILPAFLPLVYAEGLLYPYLSLKTVLFRALGVIATALFVYLVSISHHFYWQKLKNKTTWLAGIFLFTAYISSLFGVDFYHSFWSVFNRGDGLLTLTFVVFFFYFILLSGDKEFFKRFIKMTAIVGALAAIYALLQWIQIAFNLDLPFIESPHGRIGGTVGNAAFLAAYLGVSLFTTLASSFFYAGKWRNAHYAGAFLQAVAIFATGTRGSILALFAIFSLAVAFLSWKGSGRLRLSAKTVLAVILIFTALFFIFRVELRQSSLEPIRRLASISSNDLVVSNRLSLWSGISREALKRPIIGSGAEHIEALFNRIYDPTVITEEWFDRSHNAFVDSFAQFGIVGLVLYLAILFAFARAAFNLWKSGQKFAAPLVILVLVYALQNFFVFDTAITVWLLFAIFAGLFTWKGEESSNALVSGKAFSLIGMVLSLGILLLVVPVSWKPIRANMLLAQGYLYHVADVPRAIDIMKKGLSLNTYADLEYGYQLYVMYTEQQMTILSGESRIDAYHFAESVLKNNLEKYPYDARTATFLAQVIANAPPEVVPDEAYLRKVLDRAIALSPKRIQPSYILANISLRKGDVAKSLSEKKKWYEEAIGVITEYAVEAPTYAEPPYILAGIYLTLGDRVRAKEWADKGLALYEKDKRKTETTIGRGVRYYITVEDWPNASRFLEDKVASNSEDFDSLYDLAKASLLAGNRARALEIVEYLRKVKPGFVETDPEFMKAIGS